MNARHRIGIATGVLLAAGIAGWCSVREPDTAAARVVIPALPDKPSPPPAADVSKPAATPGEALTALERELVRALDPGAGTFTGERLAELVLEDHPSDLPGPNAANSYAKGWAAKNPREMFEWLQRRGGFTLPMRSANANYSFLNTLFHQWMKQDPAAAVSAALSITGKRDRADALVEVISELRKSDPARAAALAAEHIAKIDGNTVRGFSAYGNNYRETWDFLRALPAGQARDGVLARYFDDIVRYHGKDCAQLWQEVPVELRRSLIAGGFRGMYLGDAESAAGSPATLEGLDDLRREHIEATGDPNVTRVWLNNGAHEWAQRDPAAAIAWAQQHLKGEQRVNGTAQMFSAGAEKNFDATLQLWQSLPDGILRARAAGHLAAGAPAERKAEVDALMESLSPADRGIAATARQTAGNAQRQRESMEQFRRSMIRPEG
jgi:hypothetical protein